ncbi:MAG TPA: long-chain-fatty-acid--CoA ligase [Blastocatellia bacterium]|nr:long-chain-fatty-acid--CoA ligase [Blastocatellia bacterium]
MAMSIVQGLKKSVAQTPEKLASICGGTRLTFREVDERVNRLSSGLARLGVGPGDRVAILALNCHQFYEFYYAVPQVGAAVVPINFRLPPHEVKYIIDHSGSRVVAVDQALLPVIQTIRASLDSAEHFILMGDEPCEGYLSYEELLAGAAADFEAPDVSDDELLGLFYTSGTTGEPKGVMLSHRNMLANIANSEGVYNYLPTDIYLHAAPMFHLADGAAVFTHTANGATQAFIPRFDPKQVLETIARERVSLIVLVPTMINFLLHEPGIDSYDLSSLRHLTYGASPIAPDLLRRAMKIFDCSFGQGYGLTEASPLLTVLTADDHLTPGPEGERRLASCGKPVPGVDVRVVKEDGSDAKPGEVGEIIARGPNIMLGYWKRLEDTENVLRDGWLHTGDLATVDEEGYIYLVDRKKDMIVTGGENVFSTEVEAVLYAHPAVKEAAVIPIPDPDWGEAVHACVVLRDGKLATAEELTEFCGARLANYKTPHSIEFIDGELPKGGTGKILKKQLRERYWKHQTRRIG